MGRRSIALGLVALATAALLCSCSRPPNTAPRANKGKKWRIAYLQGGDFADYTGHLVGLVNGLERLGWVRPTGVVWNQDSEDALAVWRELAKPGASEYIEFVQDAFWSASWQETTRRQVRGEVIRRLRERPDIDAVLAMGTWAGQDLATDEHGVPIIVMSTSDPVRARIIRSPEDSGYRHVHAMCNPERYVRQLHVFHNIIGFERLGLVYEDTIEGRAWSNVEDVRAVAAQRGFQVVERHVSETDKTPGECVEQLVEVWDELAPQIDALWLTTLLGEEPRAMPGSLQPLLANKVATWSQAGVRQVRRGALLSISERDLSDAGLFYATVLARVLNGEQPGDIEQVFEDPRALAINARTAELIGLDVPGSLLGVADQVFTEIDGYGATGAESAD